jgi:hypothetical protein
MKERMDWQMNDGWIGREMDGWMDGWTAGRMDRWHIVSHYLPPLSVLSSLLSSRLGSMKRILTSGGSTASRMLAYVLFCWTVLWSNRLDFLKTRTMSLQRHYTIQHSVNDNVRRLKTVYTNCKRQSSTTTHLRRCRGERRYSSYSFTTSALDGGECRQNVVHGFTYIWTLRLSNFIKFWPK